MPNRHAVALVAPEKWAPEPTSPTTVDLARFARAIRTVCPRVTTQLAEQYARWIDASARAQREDPFLIAAVMSRASHCMGDAKEMAGIGVTGIQPEMYSGNINGNLLEYEVQEGDHWRQQSKLLSKPMTVKNLRDPETNIEWAAALLAMWHEQDKSVDAQFEQEPHRHYVSHFIWGDRVLSPRAEDSVFAERRRLLAHYGEKLPEPTQEFRNIVFGSPLEGSPRSVSSKPGADRDRGLRMHRGVDVEAAMGEPVLAMADGKVSFAGVDLPGRGTAVDLSPERIGKVKSHEMGAGGRYVCITHSPQAKDRPSASENLVSSYAPDSLVTAVPRDVPGQRHDDEQPEDVDTAAVPQTSQPKPSEIKPAEITVRDPSRELVTCYMHLNTTRVRSGQQVKRGEIIGTVGRTGCKESPAHLHLELKSTKELFDARDVLSEAILVGDPPWHSAAEKRRARKRARAEGFTSRALTGLTHID